MAGPKRLLFISNGHGEDAIAAAIIRQLPTGYVVEAYPTLGSGKAYADVCTLVGPRAELPSEGWRNVKGSIAKDITGGGIRTLWPGLRFFRRARSAYDRVVVVGDMIGVYGCFLTGIRNIVYLDVYKTGYGAGYLPFDRPILRATASTVFCRAPNLAADLVRASIDARSAGNVMMDTIPAAPYDAGARRTRALAVTILPGSRAHAVANFALQAAALTRMPPQSMPDLFMAVAPSIDLGELARRAGLTHAPATSAEPTDLGTFSGNGITINLLNGSAMGCALAASDLVLSQAGTATIQALGMGRPAITFQSPQDRPSRFRDEGLLFGEARQVVAADPAAIAQKLSALLADPSQILRLAKIGSDRIGGPGALSEIIAAL